MAGMHGGMVRRLLEETKGGGRYVHEPAFRGAKPSPVRAEPEITGLRVTGAFRDEYELDRASHLGPRKLAVEPAERKTAAQLRREQQLATMKEVARLAPDLLGRRALAAKTYAADFGGNPTPFDLRDDLIEVLHRADFRRDYDQHVVTHQSRIEGFVDGWNAVLHAEFMDCAFATGPRAEARRREEADKARATAEARQSDLNAIADELVEAEGAGTW